MKKFLTLLLSIILTITCLGCKNSEDSKTKKQYECGKTAYDELLSAADICFTIGSTIYDAWYFAIYEADEYGYSTILSNFCEKTNLSITDVKKTLTFYDIDESTAYYLGIWEDFNYTVNIANKTLELNGTIKKLDTHIFNAKEQLKTMTQQYSDYSEYPTLKSLFSKIDSYAIFLKNPTGSFEQLKSTIEGYNNDIRTLKSDLSFIFED